MSPRSSDPRKAPPAAPADPDVYVGLLFVSTAALITGIVFLFLELGKYNWTGA